MLPDIDIDIDRSIVDVNDVDDVDNGDADDDDVGDKILLESGSTNFSRPASKRNLD
jgi:hypothetical protein